MRALISSPEDLGRLVRKLRDSRGWTQQQLADALGSTQRYVYELEAGKPKRADARYFELLTRLGISLIASADEPRSEIR